jgi:hypothetical protein
MLQSAAVLPPMLAAVLQMTREHIKDEESNCLPQLSQALQPTELQRLARQFAAARGVAPTR